MGAESLAPRPLAVQLGRACRSLPVLYRAVETTVVDTSVQTVEVTPPGLGPVSGFLPDETL